MRKVTGHEDGCGLTELCVVFAVDEPHPVNGSHHDYKLIRSDLADGEVGYDGETGRIRFQRGPRHEPDSTAGTIDGAVLSVLIDRYECFQRGPFSCPENEEVLQYLLSARSLIIQRAQERASRGVLGKNVK